MTTAELAALLSALSVLVALASFAVSLLAERRSRRSDAYSRMPVLVSSEMRPTSMTLSNLGNGPALNVVVAAAGAELADLDAPAVQGAQLRATRWTDPAHLQPIAAHDTCTVRWGGATVVGLAYTDAFGRGYTTLASTFGTKTFDGRLIQGVRLRDLPYAPRA
jgi:hypothetical protein